jgi:TrmH family RNA methyltransferase
MLITSKDNKYIKLFRSLSTSKKARSEQGLLAVEGERLVVDNLDRVKYLFAEEKFSGRFGTSVCEFIITEELAENITQTENPQGIFAIMEKPSPKELPKEGKFVVLCDINDPGNLGTIIRTSCALGIDAVICYNSCDVYNPKTIRASMGAVFAVCVKETRNIGEMFDFFSANSIITVATVLEGENILDISFEGSCAIFIGNEARGLGDIADLCDKKATINIKGIESLNASVAAGVFIWEMTKQTGGCR